jgi:hypothetical protein
MKKTAVNPHKAHKSLQWRIGAWWPRATVPLPGSRRGAAAGHCRGAYAKRRPRGQAPLSLRGSLNWSLRRYVRASSPRVWLRRHAPEAGAASVPSGRIGLPRAAGLRVGMAGQARSPASDKRANGVSRPSAHALRYRTYRNRQMEHLTQVAASLRGGVRRGTVITTRERADVRDLGLTTFSSRVCVLSNIFKFVMT